MQVTLQNLGKKYNGHWIFQDLNFKFVKGTSYAILGSNGSGKSTLMKMISGFVIPTTGSIKYLVNSNEVQVEDIYKYISATTPYTELYEELNIIETYQFHNKFKPLSISVQDFVQELDLPVNRAIKDFSSGMKQKLKLGLTIFSNSPALLFDEPTNNLDQNARNWFTGSISEKIDSRIIIICSNYLKEEYSFCTESLEIGLFKAKPV